ncbi:TetR/AcrR family transcriptional regulator [Actinomadura rubrisoli]|uniref:TetR/AcrR family transcriptional regulator n=1 Tax=Actinomadura rubrisoli TaxID=2530368 RepID=A0A4R5AHL0_9ACTN|nr:TetR/AcrR family transcriptional regulator [Actinomadura rubrisoli]
MDDTPQAPAPDHRLARTRTRTERADVRRNRARLLTAARETFLRDGADASLEGVARLAGVGIGTLYRHFPTRQDLLEALLTDVYDDLAARARDLLPSPEPGEALMTWLRAFISHVTEFRGMAASVLVTLRDERSDLFHSCRTMRAEAESLFVRAQKTGDVPAAADFPDVLTLAGAIAMATEQQPATADRLVSLAATGLLSPKPHYGQ